MPKSNFDELDEIFNPRSVAVVGASNNPTKFGHIFLKAMIDAGFPKIYPVHPKGGEILGLKAYKSMEKIPDIVDYVVISISAKNIPDVILDCGKKGVKAVNIFTADYSESGTEEGKNREEALVKLAKSVNVRIIGPNCMGIYNPTSKIAFFPGISKEKGTVGFISQSGGHAEEFAFKGPALGVKYSKIVSFGNASDLDSTDFLEYLSCDSETEIIAIYIEGPKDGKRFFGALKEASKKKTVVVWKGGGTEGGSRACASHTGSLSGSNVIWQAALKQSGVISVNNAEEMGDTLQAITMIKPPKGNRISIVGAGGGASVSGTDDCERQGLSVQEFSPKTQEKLKKIIPPLGTGVKNPVDVSYFLLSDFSIIKKCIEISADDPNIDAIIAQIGFFGIMRVLYGGISEEEFDKMIIEILLDVKRINEEGFPEKPVVIVLQPPSDINHEIKAIKFRQTLIDSGLCVYPSISRAAKVLSNLVGVDGCDGLR